MKLSLVAVVNSTRLVEGGTIRITATVMTPAQPGELLRGRFAVKNVSAEPQEIQLDYAKSLWLIVRADGHTTYGTRRAVELMHSHGGPRRLPVTLQPGATATRPLPYFPVVWSGPLRVVPGWNHSRLPALRVPVSTLTPPVDDFTAMTDVVEKTGHLIDNCRPVSSGVPVIGWIDAPKNSAPPLRASCSITLHTSAVSTRRRCSSSRRQGSAAPTCSTRTSCSGRSRARTRRQWAGSSS